MLHSTRGSAETREREYRGTVNYLATPGTPASAHAVIGDDEITEMVAIEREAWTQGWMNNAWCGLEIVQPRRGDPITDRQYELAAWWLRERFFKRYSHLSPSAATLPEHRLTPQGKSVGKSDIGAPFSLQKLLALIQGG